MMDNQTRPQRELLAKARNQLAFANREFQRGLSTVKDPVQRKRLADAYTELMHRYVTKVRAGVETPNDAGRVIDDRVDGDAKKPKMTGKALAAVTGLGAAAFGAVRALSASRTKQVTVTPPETSVPLSGDSTAAAAIRTEDPIRTEDL